MIATREDVKLTVARLLVVALRIKVVSVMIVKIIVDVS
jgi:hypothetical protein